MALEQRGKYVVGLQPDDRMPNDWLRMVARVFASYRKLPLEQSIVAYIDGLNLEITTDATDNAVIKITSGQCFIDDQFIGFEEDSFLTVDKRWLNPNEEYCVTLKYQWINQMPPQEPHFLVTSKSIAENSEQMLCLGYIVLQDDGTLLVKDIKRPWYLEMVEQMVGDTEIDGPEKLPYIVSVKQDETFDIGWALDFHHYVGNNVDYDIRIHTDRSSDSLYINGQKILTELDSTSPDNPSDPSDPQDSYTIINNNIVIVDGNTPSSDSGKACLSLKIDNNDLTVANPGASWCVDENSSVTIQNRTDFEDITSVINSITITNQEDIVTINGKPIWHAGNLDSSGKNIYYLGTYSIGDPADFPETRLDGTPLQDGDTLYNDSYHAYFYYQNGEWAQVGKSESVKQYEFQATEGQTSVKCKYNPDFVVVAVSGIILTRSDYIAVDGEYIIFNRPLEEGEMVSISTILSGQGIGLRVEELADVSFVNLQDFDVLAYHNNKWINYPVSVASLANIGDVEFTTLNDRDILVYDNMNQKWVNEIYPRFRIIDIEDVILTDPMPNEILQYKTVTDASGTTIEAWVNVDLQQAISESGGVPAGTVLPFAGQSIPTGYLECNGAAVSRTTYDKLFDAIGTIFGSGDGTTTFNIPDLRGEFVRGWDNGRGVDPNRSFGSPQNDASRVVSGSFTTINEATNFSGAFYGGGDTTINISGSDQAAGKIVNFDSSLSTPTADENRPRNVALMYIIKY